MKNVSLYAFAFLTFFLTVSCDKDQPISTNAEFNNINPNFRISTADVSLQRASYDEPCMVTNLIAGQHHIAGTVSVDLDGDDLVITYTTNENWSIQATHLSIGNCEDKSIPTTGSGNPKVGHFEHSTTHNPDVNTVSYYLDASVLQENYCFAAHAEVNGPTGGETAWAEGTDFAGNNWAMFVEAYLSDCNVDDAPVEK